MTIRTKWHRVVECAARGTSAVFCTGDLIGFDNLMTTDLGIPPEEMAAYMAGMNHMPRFIIDDQLIEMTADPSFHLSIRDMARAGVLRLPYPEMFVELTADAVTTQIVMLIDMNQSRHGLDIIRKSLGDVVDFDVYPFMTMTFTHAKATPNSIECVGIPPCTVFLGMDPNVDPPSLRSVAIRNRLLGEHPMVDYAISTTKMQLSGAGAIALFCATLLMSTDGVEREAITAGNLNRKRTSRGDPVIPDHIYVHIGRVYRGSGNESEKYDVRKSPRPHWRRGHLRTVHVGAGRTASRRVFIPARLVAMKDDATIPPHEYVVTK